MATGSSAKKGKKPAAPPPDASQGESPAGQDSHAAPVQPLQPRPRLFALTAVVFAVWVLFLVGLYFKTVPPHRSTAPKPDASGAVLPSDPS